MHDSEVEAIHQAVAALQAQSSVLDAAVLEAALRPLRDRLAALQSQQAVKEPVESPQAVPIRKLRNVTILFLDIVGSTQLIQHLDPEDAQAVVDGALAAFSLLVAQHRGEVLRYAGDSLKAAFGADRVADDDAERAVACGLALLQESRRLGRTVQQAHGLTGFDARVGIHSGPVVRGGGVEQGSSLTGLAVHVAARIEQAALPGTLRISVDTYRQVQESVDVEEQPPLLVKGLDDVMRTFVVKALRERHLRGPRHGIDGITAALVGREAELAQLRAAAAAVLAPDGTLRTVHLFGDAGLGKSRLLTELQATLPPAVRADGLWRASAQPQGQDQPYGLLRELLFRKLGVRDSQSQEQAKQTFATALQPVFGDAADEQVALLGQLIGLDYSASAFVAGILADSTQRRALGLNAWLCCMSLQAARQPLVLLLDDLHWADDESLDALDHLATLGSTLPLLLLSASRPGLLERRPHWGQDGPAHQRLRLTPLPEHAGEALADALLSRYAEPLPALKALLAQQAVGNPYYMEALLQMLMDTDAARIMDGRWEAQPELLQGQKVPGTLAGVLQVTLDALDAPELRSLQQASVVGARFWDEALAALDPSSVEQLPALSRRELTLLQDESAFTGTLEYAFRHHLLHQVTYETVLKSDRRLAHARTALWLQGRGRGREGEIASQIAEHCERAGDTEQAINFWLRAAEDAAQREANVVALRHADRALALDDGSDLRRRLRLYRVRADVHRRQGHADEHAQELDTMESLIDRIDDDVLRLSVAFDRVWRLSLQARFAELVELAMQRLASAPGGAPQDAARLHGLLYLGLARLGRKDEAMAHALQGLALARAAGDLVTVGQIHTYVGTLEMEADRIGIALGHHHQAMVAYQTAASPAGMVAVRINLAHVQATLGKIPAARDLLLQAIGECRDTGNRRMEAIAHANIAGLWVEVGELETGYATALEGLRLAALVGETRIAAWAHNSAQYAAHSLARFELALDHARRAEEGFRVHAVHSAAWINAAAAARNLFALGRVEEAHAAAVALLVEVDTQGGWDAAFELAYLLHQVLAPLGHPRAPALLTTAYQLLSTQADKLADHIPRETFLLGTSLHRAICEQWQAAQARETMPMTNARH